MPDQDMPALNPELAIWEKDLPELERALGAGWTLPRARSKEGGSVEDLSLVIRVISLRWEAGWKAMSQAFPRLRESQVLWTLALRQAVPGVVEDMLEHGQSATEPLDNGLLPIHVVAEAMGLRPGEPVSEEDLLATAALLIDAGADPRIPQDSEYVAGDNSPGGHCLWSRAMFFGRWGIARAYLPGSWEDLLALPRGLEMVNDLHHRFGTVRNPGAPKMWADLMGEWMGPWLASQTDELFARPDELAALPDFPEPVRKHVWERWARPDSQDWTGMHELALSGKDARAHRALAIALADDAPCLVRWDQPDQDGMRPSDLWEIANDRTPQTQATDIRSLPEIAGA